MAIHTIVIADLCFSSRLYMAVLPDFAQRILLSTLLFFTAIYIGISIFRGYVIPVLLAMLAISLVIGQILIFESNWGMPPNWTGAGQYSVFLSFVPFFILSKDGMAPYAMRILYFYACLYVFFYISFVIAYQIGIVPTQISAPLLLKDAERGDRFFSYAGALAYAWFITLLRVREKMNAATITLCLVILLANLLTLSRVYLACLAFVTIMSLMNPPRWLIRTACLGTLFLVSGVLLYGMVDTRWNPFFTFSSNDSSGLGRGLEYQVAQDLIARSPIFGLGLSSSPEQPFLLTGLSFFATTDLGPAGVLLDLGILGLCLFFVASSISCAYIRYLPTVYAESLFLNGCTIALYGSIAPVLFAPGGTFYFAVILGMWLAREIRAGPFRQHGLHFRGIAQ